MAQAASTAQSKQDPEVYAFGVDNWELLDRVGDDQGTVTTEAMHTGNGCLVRTTVLRHGAQPAVALVFVPGVTSPLVKRDPQTQEIIGRKLAPSS